MIFHGSLSILFPRDMKHLLFIRVHLKFISCSCVPVNFKLLLSSKKSLKDKERSTGFITVTTLKIKIEEFYNSLFLLLSGNNAQNIKRRTQSEIDMKWKGVMDPSVTLYYV